MVYGTYNYSFWGESKPTNITGGPHIVWFYGPKIVTYQHPSWPISQDLADGANQKYVLKALEMVPVVRRSINRFF